LDHSLPSMYPNNIVPLPEVREEVQNVQTGEESPHFSSVSLLDLCPAEVQRQVQQVQKGAGSRPVGPVSGRERQPSLAWRESKRPSRGDDFVISGIQSPATPAGGKPVSPARRLATHGPFLARWHRVSPLDARRPGPRGRLPGRRFRPRPAGCNPSTADNGSDRSNEGGLRRKPRRVQPPQRGGAGRCGPPPRGLSPCSGGCSPSNDHPRAVARVAIGRKPCPPGLAPQQFTHALGGHGAEVPVIFGWMQPLQFGCFSSNRPRIGSSDLVQRGATLRP
jgi:hypothetical protein